MRARAPVRAAVAALGALACLLAALLLPGPPATASDPLAPRCGAARVVLGARTYFLCVPRHRAATVPVVVVVHGYTSSPRAIDSVTGWSALGEEQGFATAFPVGVDASFDAGTCCGLASRDRVDDVGFVDALAADAHRRAGPGPTYYAGFSNGAMLGYRLDCEDRGRISAFVAVAGTATVPACAPSHPRPLLAVNGLADTVVPYLGCRLGERGTGCGESLGTSLVPVRQVLSALRRAGGCTGTTTASPFPGASVVGATGCSGAAPLSIVLTGVRHAWPRSATGFDATRVAWDFLRGFGRA